MSPWEDGRRHRDGDYKPSRDEDPWDEEEDEDDIKALKKKDASS